MRKSDKLKNMVKANKAFQNRFDEEDETIQEKEFIYTPIPDMHPGLSRLLK